MNRLWNGRISVTPTLVAVIALVVIVATPALAWLVTSVI